MIARLKTSGYDFPQLFEPDKISLLCIMTSTEIPCEFSAVVNAILRYQCCNVLSCIRAIRVMEMNIDIGLAHRILHTENIAQDFEIADLIHTLLHEGYSRDEVLDSVAFDMSVTLVDARDVLDPQRHTIKNTLNGENISKSKVYFTATRLERHSTMKMVRRINRNEQCDVPTRNTWGKIGRRTVRKALTDMKVDMSDEVKDSSTKSLRDLFKQTVNADFVAV